MKKEVIRFFLSIESGRGVMEFGCGVESGAYVRVDKAANNKHWIGNVGLRNTGEDKVEVEFQWNRQNEGLEWLLRSRPHGRAVELEPGEYRTISIFFSAVDYNPDVLHESRLALACKSKLGTELKPIPIKVGLTGSKSEDGTQLTEEGTQLTEEGTQLSEADSFHTYTLSPSHGMAERWEDQRILEAMARVFRRFADMCAQKTFPIEDRLSMHSSCARDFLVGEILKEMEKEGRMGAGRSPNTSASVESCEEEEKEVWENVSEEKGSNEWWWKWVWGATGVLALLCALRFVATRNKLTPR